MKYLSKGKESMKAFFTKGKEAKGKYQFNYSKLKILLLIFLIVAMLFTSCTIFKESGTLSETDKQELPALIPYRVKDKWGYCDRDRKIVIQPAFTEAHLFNEGLALVAVSGKFGFIDESGKIVIEPAYSGAGDFHEDLAMIEVHTRNAVYGWGFINKKGEIVIEPTYDQVFDFKGNFAVVKVGNKCGVINKNGNIIVKIKYDQLFIAEGNEGLFAAQFDEKYGLLDAGEKVIMPFDYEWIGEYVDELILVTQKGMCGFANTKGKVAIGLSYDFASDFHEGLAAVCIGEKYSPVRGKCGFINEKGQIVIQLTYDGAGDFSEGLAPVMLNGQWGVINSKNELIIQPTDKYIYTFSDGLAFIEQDSKKGFIDSEGKMVLTIPDFYDELGYTTDYYFHDGLLAVYSHPFPTTEVILGYIDKKGTQYWED